MACFCCSVSTGNGLAPDALCSKQTGSDKQLLRPLPLAPRPGLRAAPATQGPSERALAVHLSGVHPPMRVLIDPGDLDACAHRVQGKHHGSVDHVGHEAPLLLVRGAFVDKVPVGCVETDRKRVCACVGWWGRRSDVCSVASRAVTDRRRPPTLLNRWGLPLPLLSVCSLLRQLYSQVIRHTNPSTAGHSAPTSLHARPRWHASPGR